MACLRHTGAWGDICHRPLKAPLRHKQRGPAPRCLAPLRRATRLEELRSSVGCGSTTQVMEQLVLNTHDPDNLISTQRGRHFCSLTLKTRQHAGIQATTSLAEWPGLGGRHTQGSLTATMCPRTQDPSRAVGGLLNNHQHKCRPTQRTTSSKSEDTAEKRTGASPDAGAKPHPGWGRQGLDPSPGDGTCPLERQGTGRSALRDTSLGPVTFTVADWCP